MKRGSAGSPKLPEKVWMKPPSLPSSFLGSRAARVDLARQRFFDEGVAPTGVVTEAVFQSWSRCLRLRHRPGDLAVFEPVTASRTQLALQKNRQLLRAWNEVSPTLEALLGTTRCAAMLTDATGVLIGARCAGRAHEALMPVATRVGVNLSEEAVGTTAPGVVARTGKPVCVLGAEHFFDNIHGMHCAAAPIRDITGALAGVLDLSSEGMPFGFDAAAVTGLYASAIENRLLIAQSTDHLVIRVQAAEALLDSPLVGLVGIDAGGHVAWQNSAARSLLGAGSVDADHRDAVRMSFDLTISQLASLPPQGSAMLTLPNGLLVWARAQMQSPDGARKLFAVGELASNDQCVATQPAGPAAPDAPTWDDPLTATSSDQHPCVPAPAAAPVTLRDTDHALVERTLRACHGNVSEAARSLGVSRNLIYRRLRRTMASNQPPLE